MVNRIRNEFYHYRDYCGFGVIRSSYRSLHRVIRGKEPFEKRRKKLMETYWKR